MKKLNYIALFVIFLIFVIKSSLSITSTLKNEIKINNNNNNNNNNNINIINKNDIISNNYINFNNNHIKINENKKEKEDSKELLINEYNENIINLINEKSKSNKNNNNNNNNNSKNKKINYNFNNNIINPLCNQNTILKDWGFQNLKLNFDNNNITDINNITTIHGQYWTLSYSGSGGYNEVLNISFVDQLEESFFSTSIVGYSAIRISSFPNQPLQGYIDTFLNQTIAVIPEKNYTLYFEISTTIESYSLFVLVDDEVVATTEPSKNTFERLPITINLEPSFLKYPTSRISIRISFLTISGEMIPPTYIENVRIQQILYGYDNSQSLVYVSNNGSDVTGNGSKENPFSSIQQAILFLDWSVEATILVSPGFYCGLGNSYIDFSFHPFIEISSLEENNKPIFSGEYYTDSISFSTISSLSLIISNIKFIRSSVRPGGSSIIINGNCSLSMFSVDFDEHYGDNVVLLNYLTNTIFESCNFYNNTQYAIQAVGVFGLDQIIITNCSFYSINSMSFLNVRFVSIDTSNYYYSHQNQSSQQCPILLDMVEGITVQSSTINTAFCIYRSSFYGTGLIFKNQPPNIYIQSALLTLNSDAFLENSTFSGPIYYSCMSSFQGKITISGSSFKETGSKNSILMENVKLLMFDTVFYKESTSLALTNVNGTIKNVESRGSGTNSQFLSSTDSILLIYDSRLFKMTNIIVQSEISTSNCTFSNGINTVFQLSNTFYQDFQSNVLNNTQYHIISNGLSTIRLNGTIVFNNQYTTFVIINDRGSGIIDRIQYIKNTADTTWGGAFLLSESVELNITNSYFRNNSCTGSGGIVYLPSGSKLLMRNCTATQNIGFQNGGIIFSAGQNDILIDGGFYLENYLYNNALGVFIFYYGNQPTITANTFYSQGETIVLGVISLFCESNIPQIIQSGSGPYQLFITFEDSKHSPLNGYQFDKTIHIFISYSSGLIATIPVKKLPYNTATITVEIDELVGQINSTQSIFINSDSNSITSQTLGFIFDFCPMGYYPNEDNTLCLECPFGTYGMNSQCESCPLNTWCYGGKNITGLTGYWVIADDTSINVYECPNNVCFRNDTIQNTTCAPFSDGLLCAGCIDGYYNCGSGCKKETSINKLVLTTKIIMFFILVITQQWSSDNSGLVTIALYFMQTLAVISSGIKFSILTTLSGSVSAHSGRSNSILSVLNDCLGPFGFYWNHYFILLQPIFLFLVLIFIISLELILRKTGIIFKIPFIKDIVEKTDKEFRNRQFSTFIKVCMNSYGPFATELLLILFCEQVGPYELLNANPEVQCNGMKYDNAKKITFGLMSILVLFPIIIFILLYRIKDRLDDKGIERQYGVFYLKYVPKLYFWDVTLLLKRLSIVTVSLIQFQSNYRSVILVTLGLIFLFVHLKFQPFVTDQDNHLETVSLILLFISCIYLDNGLYEDTEQWILIICVVSFLLAAIKFQSKYLMNEFNKTILPIIKKIYEKVNTSSNSEIDNQYKVIYDYDDSDNEDEDTHYAYDSSRNVIKVVDKKSNYFNNFSNININSNSPNNNYSNDALSSSYTYGDDNSDDDEFFNSNQIKRRI